MSTRPSANTDPFDWEPKSDAPPPATPKLYQVSELTRLIKESLDDIGRVSVEGEVTRVTQAASGHVYFDLKDLDAKIACTVWKSHAAAAAKVGLKEGAKIIAHGKLDVYAPRGTYSLNVTRLEVAGLGALLVKLEELKQKLKADGWFDRHRPLPALPRMIGVATSRDGAAFQDFLRTRSMRWPLFPVRLAHTSVQGAGAAREIAAAIARLDASQVDVIVLCRGGGSLEDLWAFNEMPVLEAIRRCSVPVVCGVGHETDTTVADLVADVRAHTPTDAAQIVIPDRALYLEKLSRAHNELLQAVDSVLEARLRRLERIQASPTLRDPRWILERRAERLTGLGRALKGLVDSSVVGTRARVEQSAGRLARKSPALVLAQCSRRVDALETRLRAAANRPLETRARRLDLCERTLSATSPLAVLARGYSITWRMREGALAGDGGAPLESASQVAAGDLLETRLSHGSIISKVERTHAPLE